jgi:hypothetical protein
MKLPLSSSRRSTCVKGCVTLIVSVTALCRDILMNKYQKFFCTYTLRQDNLELFFNCVRRAGCWNNPSVVTFNATFKKIMAHCGALQVSNSGNCQPVNDVELVTMSTSE